MIISTTGVINGRGSDIYKYVSGLTADERRAARNGELVLVPDGNTHPACTPYKRVLFNPRYNVYQHRCYHGEVSQ